MKSKYKPLPRNTKLIVEFHDGIHSTYTTKDQIIKMNVFNPQRMSLSLVNALDKLEADRRSDFETFGVCMTVAAVGYVTGVDGKQHTYSLEMAAHRLENQRHAIDTARRVCNLIAGKGI